MVLFRRKDRVFCRNMQEKGWKKVRNLFTFVRKPFLCGIFCGKIKRKTYICSTVFIYFLCKVKMADNLGLNGLVVSAGK